MNSTIKITKLCPKCGLHRENTFENHKNGDPTALNLLRSCPECKAWLAIEEYYRKDKPQPNPAIETALAGILEVVKDWRQQISKEIPIPTATAAIRAILEALVEDVRANLDTERKMRP